MSATTTVVFADLTGSTRLFEALGNAAATQVVTQLTGWIGHVCQAHGGRVVKNLGDGVLALFPDPYHAIEAAVQMQRDHRQRHDGPAARMNLKVGMACGEIVEVDGDCYGDAVNVASRLSDLSGSEQIWATESVVDQVGGPPAGVRIRGLGPVPVRGKAEPMVLFRIEWQEEVHSDMMTLPAALPGTLRPVRPAAVAMIDLSYLDQHAAFDSDATPILLGRANDAHFVVSDPRVSRLHARIDWRNGSFVLTDTSSYGSWVRFDGAATVLPLRRGECVLHHNGEIATGASFDDFTVPVVRFIVTVG
jgi:class 3 adenylate cyclase